MLVDGSGSGDTIENMIGINYVPIPNVRMRATITDKKFEAGTVTQEADADIYQVSATISF